MEKLFKLLQSDKSVHFLLCYFIATLIPWFYIGFVLAVGLSVYKELIYDRRPGHNSSWFDFLAGFGGSIVALAINIFY
jgi:hypothetical protein